MLMEVGIILNNLYKFFLYIQYIAGGHIHKKNLLDFIALFTDCCDLCGQVQVIFILSRDACLDVKKKLQLLQK